MNAGMAQQGIDAHSFAEDALAVVLAGGKGARLGALTRRECKPALPFGGLYRNIDFSLSNCVNSGIRRIGVATQYKDGSLVRHLNAVWGGGSTNRSGPVIEPWRAAISAADVGYRGTADAVYRNWERIDALEPKLVLVLAGDHVYRMDYRPMLKRHLDTKADVTVGCVEVPVSEASQFGVMTIDHSDRIVRFVEKPQQPQPLPGHPGRVLASMGIYVFNRALLERILREDAAMETSSHDFGRDVIPEHIDRARVFAYPFNDKAVIGGGYWRDVGTLKAYWHTHMEMLDAVPGSRPDDTRWPVRSAIASLQQVPSTTSEIWQLRHPAKSLLAPGCAAKLAIVRRSVLFDNVTVGADTQLSNAVVLPNTAIGRRCYLANVVIASGTQVPDGTVIPPAWEAAPTLVTADTDFARFSAQRDNRPERSGYSMQHRTGT